MTRFRRSICLERLTPRALENNPWFRELLLRWRPSGHPSERDMEERITSLRVGIRDGYLTFYCAGQQIAYVKCSETQFFEKAHYKYLDLEKPAGDPNIRVPVVAAEMVRAKLSERIHRSFEKQGKEKIFVDELAGANANVFDLELALSYSAPQRTRPVALRLDLAALESDGDGWRIALWEAKRARDGRVKARGVPLTVEQHRNYANWLHQDTNAEDFIAATRESCRALVRLHELATVAGNDDIGPLGGGIVAVGSDPEVKLTLDRNVRYVIDARDDKRGTFVGNGHDIKLREVAGTVQVIAQEQSFALQSP